MESLVFVICVVFVLFADLIVYQPIYKKHEKATSGVVNYDCNMNKFVYKVYMSGEEIIRSLKIMNVQDDLSCKFNFKKNIIIFSDLGHKEEFFYEIQEYDGFSILKLSKAFLIELKPLPFLTRKNNAEIKYGNYYYTRRVGSICYRLNPFLVNKINAEIIPFSQYGD